MENIVVILTIFNFLTIIVLLIIDKLRDNQIQSIWQYMDWITEELLQKIRDDQEYLQIIRSNLYAIDKEKYKRKNNANKK